MYIIHGDFASGVLQFKESGTLTRRPIRIEGRARAHAGAAKTLANVAAWGPLRSSSGLELTTI